MKLRLLPIIVIAAITVLVAVSGSALTQQGLVEWYPALVLPPWTPDGSFIGIAWTTIYVLTGISAIWGWHAVALSRKARLFAFLFLSNAVLNVLWSYIFFVQHNLGAAVFEMTVLNITTIALAFLIWPFRRFAAILLFPYIGWVTFATYLAYSIWKLNTPVV